MPTGYTCLGCGMFVLAGHPHVCPPMHGSTAVDTVERTNTGGTEIARLEREVAELRRDVDKLEKRLSYSGWKVSKR